MNKFEELRTHINQRVRELSQAPGGTNSITNFAKESELIKILQYMRKLDVDADLDRKFTEQVKMENESLSEAAAAEWGKEHDGFLYTGIPDFDKSAFNKILEATKIKSVK